MTELPTSDMGRREEGGHVKSASELVRVTSARKEAVNAWERRVEPCPAWNPLFPPEDTARRGSKGSFPSLFWGASVRYTVDDGDGSLLMRVSANPRGRERDHVCACGATSGSRLALDCCHQVLPSALSTVSWTVRASVPSTALARQPKMSSALRKKERSSDGSSRYSQAT